MWYFQTAYLCLMIGLIRLHDSYYEMCSKNVCCLDEGRTINYDPIMLYAYSFKHFRRTNEYNIVCEQKSQRKK